MIFGEHIQTIASVRERNLLKIVQVREDNGDPAMYGDFRGGQNSD